MHLLVYKLGSITILKLSTFENLQEDTLHHVHENESLDLLFVTVFLGKTSDTYREIINEYCAILV